MLSRIPRALPALLAPVRFAPSRSTAAAPAAVSFGLIRPSRTLPTQPRAGARELHSSPTVRKGITPDSADPAPPKTQQHAAGASVHVTDSSPLTEAEYRECSEEYFNALLSNLEEIQEAGSDVEAEYSAGVLNVNVPGVGTYVLNKQPPNKQIWLSSPISGPKRYDWVVRGDGMDEKAETSEFHGGQWIYLRDGSNLTTLLNAELGTALGYDVHKK